MQNEESLNLLNQKPGNVKNALVQKLSKQWPLTLKQLDHALKREFGMDVTYQAIHKAMQQLEEEKVVEKTKEGFQLSMQWIEEIQNIARNIKEVYSTDASFDPKKDVNELTFPTFLTAAKFIIHRFEEVAPNPERKPGICLFYYSWPIIGANEEDFDQLHKSIKQSTHYCAIRSKTPMDHIFGDALIKLGKIVKYDVDCASDCDIIIKGDYVAQVFFPDEFKNQLKKIYNKVKTVEELDLQSFFKEVVDKKLAIKIIIVRSPELANKIREFVERTFNPGKKS